MAKLLFIVAGGGCGTLLRYVLAGWGQKLANGSFPLGTLVVNLAGCFIIGFLGGVFTSPQLIREEYRVGLLVGVLGAFTTFSTFGWETITLVKGGQLSLAAVNVVLSNGLGFIAVWFGYRLSEKWLGV